MTLSGFGNVRRLLELTCYLRVANRAYKELGTQGSADSLQLCYTVHGARGGDQHPAHGNLCGCFSLPFTVNTASPAAPFPPRRFVLQHPLLASAVVGATSARQLTELLDAAECTEHLDAGVMAAIDAVHTRLPNPTP